ncbi:hypothetical protein AAMO2058_001585000 [Amorphochlora amoebiformis]
MEGGAARLAGKYELKRNFEPHVGKRIMKLERMSSAPDKPAFYFGRWDYALGVIDIGDQYGKALEGLGYRMGNRKVLFPEEALYLVERGLLAVTDNQGAILPFYQETP